MNGYPKIEGWGFHVSLTMPCLLRGWAADPGGEFVGWLRSNTVEQPPQFQLLGWNCPCHRTCIRGYAYQFSVSLKLSNAEVILGQPNVGTSGSKAYFVVQPFVILPGTGTQHSWHHLESLPHGLEKPAFATRWSRQPEFMVQTHSSLSPIVISHCWYVPYSQL